MTFNIITLGCKVNTYESEFISESLLNEGFLVSSLEDSDIVIINTCTVTNTSDNKCLKTLRSIKKNYPDKILVVCGCSSQYDVTKYDEYNIDILIGTKDKSNITKYIKEYLINKKPYKNIAILKNIEFEDMMITNFNQVRAYIKIEDGCENFCSYCIIPYVRGNLRYKDFKTVLKEANILAGKGFKEIVLTGIHTGAYPNLVNLISELSKIDQIKRIRLSSIEITELKDDFFKLLANNDKLCKHLHIPLQSGSDTILKKMNRKYDTKYYEEVIVKLRAIDKDINISTDVIVGHPYETEDNFNETINFCKKMKFSKIHTFPYSDRNGTAASRMDEKVDGKTKKERARILLNLSSVLENEYINKFLETNKTILIEEKKNDYVIGHTDNFIKLKLKKNKEINTFIDINIKNDNYCDN